MSTLANLQALRAQGLSHAEIAAATGLTRSTVLGRLWRAARKAARATRRDEGTSPPLTPAQIDALVWARVAARRAALGRTGAPWWREAGR
jgi:hypothetical protein